jgi:hypothetical protein
MQLRLPTSWERPLAAATGPNAPRRHASSLAMRNAGRAPVTASCLFGWPAKWLAGLLPATRWPGVVEMRSAAAASPRPTDRPSPCHCPSPCRDLWVNAPNEHHCWQTAPRWVGEASRAVRRPSETTLRLLRDMARAHHTAGPGSLLRVAWAPLSPGRPVSSHRATGPRPACPLPGG